MIYYLANIFVTFFRYGLSGFNGNSKTLDVKNTEKTLSDDTIKEIENAITDLLEQYNDTDFDYPHGGRVLTPFERHLAQNFSSGPQTRADAVEGMLLSLNQVGEEIQSMLPGSSIESSVDGSDLNDSILKGHLGLDIDTVTSLVYPIFMDLLKDGFVYRPDSNTFVITTKVKL